MRIAGSAFGLILLVILNATGQSIEGTIVSNGEPVSFATVYIDGTTIGTTTDESGRFSLNNSTQSGAQKLRVSAVGYLPIANEFIGGKAINMDIELKESELLMDAVTVTGTMKEVNRLESPVPVEVYNPIFFKKNPSPHIFEAMQNINGVKPQLNCSVCNTGDIHINGLEGPYTMVMIDGMPIVSSLSTVYGLFGIPNSMIERIEVVKGPASSLYGSEAIGGLINVITKKPQNASLFSADFYTTSWMEHNADVSWKAAVGEKATVLTGVNGFWFDRIVDNNSDNFTDVTLQKRISVFQKWNIDRPEGRLFSVAGRFFYEDRWGGELDWEKSYRGGSEIYGESIYTRRFEILGSYQLPVEEKVMLQFSFNDHDQNSAYGNTPFLARQQISFAQLTWDKSLSAHDLLAGIAMRHTYYDDSTPATDNSNNEMSAHTYVPGIFFQDEIKVGKSQKLLVGSRLDYHSVHGKIFTPRLAYKWTINDQNVFRLNAGTGFRVVNLFTEDHAALIGAREVVIEEELMPEQSFNVNANYVKKVFLSSGGFLGFDFAGWHTYFTNKIFPDYETDVNKIIYTNLNGYATSTGLSVNMDLELPNGLKVVSGVTAMNVINVEDGVASRQLLTEQFTGTWAVSYTFSGLDLSVDYTGNVYGPMLLPTLGENDPRSETSPTWSIQNIQFTYAPKGKYEIYGGVKNLLNWTPNKGNPFIIARSEDPFDNEVSFDAQGQPLVTANNPYGLTFDPTYLYAPNQGIRGFLGIRISIR